ncbi:uncharacterized protein LOC131030779 [Cryptomeria japonica]|uniref:uncharacterized protein LOC131030779 n=1 Tax=Cryptomeria japonica TaxID=3369 RepID=UPI0027DA65E7|nr:uncharacterized protein LOC131030779 [Cryptomeria japonica]
METLVLKSSEMTVNSTESEIECSLCGDVGLKEQLFKCASCLSRYQHTYCSRSYPNIDLERFSCEWCSSGVTEMVKTQVYKSGLNEFISDKLQSISECKQMKALTRVEVRGGKCKEKSDLFVSFNGRKQCQMKERTKLQIHARRRYKRLADLNF